jgi:hypothetical protein
MKTNPAFQKHDDFDLYQNKSNFYKNVRNPIAAINFVIQTFCFGYRGII